MQQERETSVSQFLNPITKRTQSIIIERDLFEKPCFTSCHMKLTEFEVLREGNTLVITERCIVTTIGQDLQLRQACWWFSPIRLLFLLTASQKNLELCYFTCTQVGLMDIS